MQLRASISVVRRDTGKLVRALEREFERAQAKAGVRSGRGARSRSAGTKRSGRATAARGTRMSG